MKIVHIAKFYPPEPGGIENFVFDLANSQVGQGHRVTVLSHQTGFAKSSQQETINGVTVLRVRSFGQLAHAPACPGFPRHLHAIIRRFQPDIIHAHLPNLSAFWLLFLPKTCPIVLHWHADVVSSALDRKMRYLYPLYNPCETRLIQKADRIICTSRAYLDTSPALRRQRKKCVVIPLGLDPSRMAVSEPSDTPAFKKRTNRLLVLGVGRFAYYKGFEYLIQAAEKTPDAHFIIAGDGPGKSKIQNQVIARSLQHRIFLPGQISRDELIHLFYQCDIFCLPSIERTEAFGLVLLEAMSFGKPLVTTSIAGSGVAEVNLPGVTGLQVPAANAEALAGAIQFLGRNPEIRMKMGQMAKKRFQNHFDIRFVAHRIETVYGDLIQSDKKNAAQPVYTNLF